MPAPIMNRQQNTAHGRQRRRLMVPRYSAAQTESPPAIPPPVRLPEHTEKESAVTAASPPHSFKPDNTAGSSEQKRKGLFATAGDLPARLARLDGETLLLLGILWMLWQEKADRRLLLALAYILL